MRYLRFIYNVKWLVSLLVMISLSACTVSKIAMSEDDFQVFNRTVSAYEDGIELNAAEGDGMAIFKEVDFEYGTIEVEIKGENSPGRSFVGIAFNVNEEEGYEVVYFRPFNFVAKEQDRRDHMVQYVFHPEFTWRKLRTENPGEFEAEILSPPDPDDWFTARIDVTPERVKAYIEDRKEPVLDVRRLTSTQSKKTGVWVGFNSSGRFKNFGVK